MKSNCRTAVQMHRDTLNFERTLRHHYPELSCRFLSCGKASPDENPGNVTQGLALATTVAVAYVISRLYLLRELRNSLSLFFFTLLSPSPRLPLSFFVGFLLERLHFLSHHELSSTGRRP